MLFQPNAMAGWLFCLLPASKSFALLSDVQSLYHPISLFVVGHGAAATSHQESCTFHQSLLLMKLAPLSLRSLARASKDGDVTLV